MTVSRAAERPGETYGQSLGRLVRAVRKGKTFFLTGHERPDGDTVGSELSLASVLRSMGKRVTIANNAPPPPYTRFLPGIARLRSAARVAGRFDVSVIFECSGPERTGNIIDFKRQSSTVVNIDHHAHHARWGDINLIDPDASSNSEQLIRLFDRLGHRMTAAEATALYVGVVTDTGRFQQENTRPDSHRVAARCLEAGVDVGAVHRHVYGTRSLAALKLMGRALDGFRLAEGGRVAVTRLTRNDFKATGAEDADTEDIPNVGLLPPSASVSLFLREIDDEGRVKVSLRGKNRVDLCRLAVSLGGGGHRNASGVTLSGGLDRVEKRLLDLLRRAIDRV